jgi:YD repeat-containing protein
VRHALRLQPPPVRNPSIVGAFVFSHSGEFGAVARDVRLPGFALDLELVRSYRSGLAHEIGELGRGWTCTLAQRVEASGEDVLYHDGEGGLHRFVRGAGGAFSTPDALYAVLHATKGALVLEQRYGVRRTFGPPEEGGRLVAVIDRNGNELRFAYDAPGVEVSDGGGRRLAISVEDGVWRAVADHAGRTWRFAYDDERRLVEVTRPGTRDFPDGTSLRYEYDAEHRLVALIDAKGQAYLANQYDDEGRVAAQRHGDGEYWFEYEPGGTTRCRLKNGGLLEVDHDEAGRAARTTLHVRADAFGQDDHGGGATVALVTECDYNSAGELVRRRLPSGRETRWRYDDGNADPRDHGNLLELTELPRPGVDQSPLVSRFEYAPDFQVPTASVDPRGHRTTFDYDERANRVSTTYPSVTIQPVGDQRAGAAPVERTQHVRCRYDERGRLVERTEIDGTATEYAYDREGGGLLTRIVRDAGGLALTNTYAYDAGGNCTEVRDGKGTAVRLSYNAIGCVETVVSRAPLEYRVDYRYDANYDEVEAVQSFDRLDLDRAKGETTPTTSVLREQRAYDALRNVVGRRLVGGDAVIRETFVRDAAGRTVRHIQPLGNVTEYTFDERDLVIEKRAAVGTPEGFAERFTYSLDGSLLTRTDGDGHATIHSYDGLERYRGFRDAAGTTKWQSLDDAGNVVAVSVTDGEWSLLEARYRVDEWNRVWRIDRLWHDLKSGKPAGASGWDGAKGMVSTLVEWGENGRPSKVWGESGNAATYTWDGCRRLLGMADATGASLAVAYDENGNVTELVTAGAGGAARFATELTYDAMGRLESRRVGDAPLERFRHNALGALVEYVSPSGLSVAQTHDDLGRRTGHAYRVGDQAIVREWVYDDNYRLAAYVDAEGNRTAYAYDDLDRQIRIVHPDGTVTRVDRDARGNPVRVVDANGNETSNRFDAVGRLVASTGTSGRKERFAYDGAGRLVSARGQHSLRRTYDSLSRVRTETQDRRTVRLTHDAAGNLTRIVYPGGDDVRRSYDGRRRLTSVALNGAAVAAFDYADDDRVSRVSFGDVLTATLEYDARRRLASVEYRAADGGLVDGYRYAYDAAGRMIHEMQLARGQAFGERYAFDAARRPVQAEYGVADVTDAGSAFEQRTTYDYFPEGRWRQRVDVDGAGRVTASSVGALDARGRYRRFGKYAFTYDRNGNCVRKESANPGFCLYTYDDANRLVKVECYDANAHLLKTIEYFYDALGREVKRVVTEAAGGKTETTSVWTGLLLAEEYADGELARSYVYGTGALPVRLSAKKTNEDFTYVVNGRGLVTGLVRQDDPNAFAEKYGYEVTGAAFLTEVAAVPVAIPDRSTTVSGLDSPLATGDVFGSVLSDWGNGILRGSGGGAMDTTISDALNVLGDVGAKGHHGVKDQMADQLKGIVGMLGLGGNASQPPAGDGGDHSGDNGGDMTGLTGMGPDWKLYADGDDSDLTPPPLVSVNDDGTSTVHNADGSTSTGGPAGDTPTKEPDPPKPSLTPNDSGSGSGSGATDVPKGGTPADEPKDPSKNMLNDKINQFTSDHPVIAAAIGLAIQAVHLSTSGPPKMTDPDYTGGGGPPQMPSPDELESRFNRLKHPVNPNDGGSEPVDTSSPPPDKSGPDPTLILTDPDAGTGTGDLSGTGGGIIKLDIAPVDPVRPDMQPEPPTTPLSGTSSGGGDTVGRQWPP